MQRRSSVHKMEPPSSIPSSQESGSLVREPEEEVIQSIEDTLDDIRDDTNQDTSLGRFPDTQAKDLFYPAAVHIRQELQAEILLGHASQGRDFVFGLNSATYDGTIIPFANSFAVTVLPAIIPFALYYYNIVQCVVANVATVVFHIIDISGVECVATCSAPFLGMSESSMLVGPFVSEMTEAELHQVLTSVFATISSSVFLGLLTLGADATALLTCCMMSVPCAIVISKIRFPEVDVPMTKGSPIIPAYKDREANAIHAISNGAISGIKLCIVVVSVLLAVISILALADGFLGWIFLFYGVEMSIEQLASWVLYPVAWLIGIPTQDLAVSSRVMGVKYIVNEIAAFASFTQSQDTLQPRTKLLTTYAMRVLRTLEVSERRFHCS